MPSGHRPSGSPQADFTGVRGRRPARVLPAAGFWLRSIGGPFRSADRGGDRTRAAGAPRTPARAIAASLRQFYAEATRLDLSQSDPVVAARNALGLLAPLVLAAALGSPAVGVQAAIGALQTAFADRPGPVPAAAGPDADHRAGRRGDGRAGRGVRHQPAGLRRCCWRCAPSPPGCCCRPVPAPPRSGSRRPPARWCSATCRRPRWPRVHTGLLVFAGGALQAVLAIAAWPLGRHGPERRALAALYRQLAGLAERADRRRDQPAAGRCHRRRPGGAQRRRARPRAERGGLPGAAGRGDAGPAGHPGAVGLCRPAAPGRAGRGRGRGPGRAEHRGLGAAPASRRPCRPVARSTRRGPTGCWPAPAAPGWPDR